MNCADDLVILCKRGKAGEALQRMRDVMSKLKLTVNEEKARICTVPAGEFDFLVYTLGQMYSARTGQARLRYPAIEEKPTYACGTRVPPREARLILKGPSRFGHPIHQILNPSKECVECPRLSSTCICSAPRARRAPRR